MDTGVAILRTSGNTFSVQELPTIYYRDWVIRFPVVVKASSCSPSFIPASSFINSRRMSSEGSGTLLVSVVCVSVSLLPRSLPLALQGNKIEIPAGLLLQRFDFKKGNFPAAFKGYGVKTKRTS